MTRRQSDSQTERYGQRRKTNKCRGVQECSVTTRASVDTTPSDTTMTVRNNDDHN